MNALSTKVLRSVPCARTVIRSMHSTVDDYLCFHDHDHPATQWGYRVATPYRQSSTMTSSSVDPLSYDVLHSHTTTKQQPESLDILQSPKVREIFESQREWDASLREEQTVVWAIEEEEEMDDVKKDPYMSDCEAMKDRWDVEPSLDEKPM